MMKLVEVNKAETGLNALIGEVVILFCANYFYTGKLTGVNKTEVLLEGAQIVYETGPFGDAKWKDAQPMNIGEVFVRIPMIESYGKSSKK